MARNDINWEALKQTDFSNANTLYALGHKTIQEAFDKSVGLVKQIDTDISNRNQGILNNFLSDLTLDDLHHPETRKVYDDLVDTLRYDGGGVNLKDTIKGWDDAVSNKIKERDSLAENAVKETTAKANHDVYLAELVSNITTLARTAKTQEEANKILSQVDGLASQGTNKEAVLGLARNMVLEKEAKNNQNEASKNENMLKAYNAMFANPENEVNGLGMQMIASLLSANSPSLDEASRTRYNELSKEYGSAFYKKLQDLPPAIQGRVLTNMANQQKDLVGSLDSNFFKMLALQMQGSGASSGGAGSNSPVIAQGAGGNPLTPEQIQKLPDVNSFFGTTIKKDGGGVLQVDPAGAITTLNSKLGQYIADYEKANNIPFDQWLATEGSKLPQVKIGINGNYNGTGLLAEKLKADKSIPDLQKIRMLQKYANSAPSDDGWISYLLNTGKNDVQDDNELYERLKAEAKKDMDVELASREANLPIKIRSEVFPLITQGLGNSILDVLPHMTFTNPKDNTKVFPEIHPIFWRALTEQERAEAEKLGYTNPLKSKK